MVCESCSNWKCEDLTYEQVVEAWGVVAGDKITPGVLKRYEKKAEAEEVSLETVKIGYKYCSKGVLTRLYLRKSDTDCKPVKDVKDCRHFSSHQSSIEVNQTDTIWSICVSDYQGLTKVKGISFVSGLYEEGCYMRIPLYGSTKPQVVKQLSTCSTCGKETNKAIHLKVDKTFCCNKHYVEWWAQRYREEFRKLNS